jgi:hypothetical protein
MCDLRSTIHAPMGRALCARPVAIARAEARSLLLVRTEVILESGAPGAAIR